MPRITIDEQEIEVAAGATIIQAADQAGIDIPRYCYHPGLSIVGVCRICLVEIEGMPKLQVACYTPVAEGMVVSTKSERVQQARKHVLEFLLANHPIDCPVCDQAGECWLQEYYMQFGLYDPKMQEDKNKKHKAVVVGPHVILDAERCILCTRCVRFCDEISQTHELGIFNRGDHAELMPMPGVALENPYSVNTVDICPVGALTERDFRFKTRVWYLDTTPSVCAGCSTGCNIEIHTNTERTYKAEGRRVARLKPRYNAHINQFWICDEGRYSFLHVDADNRITRPAVRKGEGFEPVSWQDALRTLADDIEKTRHGGGKIGVIGSAQMTVEDLYVLREFSRRFLGGDKIPVHLRPFEEPYHDDFLISKDRTPNTRGAELLGFSVSPAGISKMLEACHKGEIELLFVFHHILGRGFESGYIDEAFAKCRQVTFIGSNEQATSERAHMLLPASTWVEKEGSFVNRDSRIQKLNQALAPLGESKPEWKILRDLSRVLGKALAYFEPGDIFAELAASHPVFQGLSLHDIPADGQPLSATAAEATAVAGEPG